MDPTQLRDRYLGVLGLLPLAACGPLSNSTECIALEEGSDTCPTLAEARETLLGQHCGYATLQVTGEGERIEADSGDTGWSVDRCCYDVVNRRDAVPNCVVGRPYVDARGMVVATAHPGEGWSTGRRPRVSALSPEARRVLAEAWTADALVEHASVAAFARISLELLAAGAPSALVADAHAAALDEIRHARISFALAETYAGGPVAPGPFPLGGAVAVSGDRAAFAVATFHEGCVGETLVALLSAEACAAATDPAVRAALTAIARDEARHAELAWRSVKWALESGGEAVRVGLLAAIEAVAREGVELPRVTTGADPRVLAAHGRIRAEAARRAVERGLAEVVLPCSRALVAAPTLARGPATEAAGARA